VLAGMGLILNATIPKKASVPISEIMLAKYNCSLVIRGEKRGEEGGREGRKRGEGREKVPMYKGEQHSKG
jgi:hypothetical protein